MISFTEVIGTNPDSTGATTKGPGTLSPEPTWVGSQQDLSPSPARHLHLSQLDLRNRHRAPLGCGRLLYWVLS